MEVIFSLRQLIEKFVYGLHQFKKEKTYDRVSRDLIWLVLNRKNDPKGYNEIDKEYEGAVTSVITTCREMGGFPVATSLHRGLVLSPYFFALIMDDLSTTHI